MDVSSTQEAREDVVRALDPQVSGPELLRLAVHRDPAVRVAIATRSDCPMGALIALGHDHAVDVLEALIGNPRTPSSVIRNLADHRDSEVARAALERLRTSLR